MERLGGEAAYWKDHLALTRTAVALVNQEWPEGTNGTTLRWVPFATTLLLPLPAESLASRDPMTRADLGRSRDALTKLLRQAGLPGSPRRSTPTSTSSTGSSTAGRPRARWR